MRCVARKLVDLITDGVIEPAAHVTSDELNGRHTVDLVRSASLAPPGDGKILAVPTDVSPPDSVQAAFTKTKEVFGRLDILFNNAGINAPSVPMEDLTYEHWTQVVGINLTGAFLCAQAAIRLMKAQQPPD